MDSANIQSFAIIIPNALSSMIIFALIVGILKLNLAEIMHRSLGGGMVNSLHAYFLDGLIFFKKRSSFDCSFNALRIRKKNRLKYIFTLRLTT